MIFSYLTYYFSYFGMAYYTCVTIELFSLGAHFFCSILFLWRILICWPMWIMGNGEKQNLSKQVAVVSWRLILCDPITSQIQKNRQSLLCPNKLVRCPRTKHVRILLARVRNQIPSVDALHKLDRTDRRKKFWTWFACFRYCRSQRLQLRLKRRVNGRSAKRIFAIILSIDIFETPLSRLLRASFPFFLLGWTNAGTNWTRVLDQA